MREVQESLPKQYRSLSLFLVPFRQEDEAWLLKTPHIADEGFGGNDLALTWKIPHWGLVLIVLEGAMQAAKEGKQSSPTQLYCQWITTMTSMARNPERNSSDTYIRNQQSPNWTEDPPKRREFIPGTINLASYLWLMRAWFLENSLLPLNQHKLCSKYSSLYPALTQHRINLFLQ